VGACSRTVRLPGGYTYTVRTARVPHTCSRCRKSIAPGEVYVEERPFRSQPRRYHIRCFATELAHRVRVDVVGGEVCLSAG